MWNLVCHVKKTGCWNAALLRVSVLPETEEVTGVWRTLVNGELC